MHFKIRRSMPLLFIGVDVVFEVCVSLGKK